MTFANRSSEATSFASSDAAVNFHADSSFEIDDFREDEEEIDQRGNPRH
jgi:hypothetical protein